MSEITYRGAIAAAIGDAMEADEDVFLLGEDVGKAGGAFKATEGLYDRFGRERVLDTPISEQAIVGTAIGAAVMGLRPVAEIMFADFAAVCFDQIVNELAKYRYMTGGQVNVPVTIRLGNGAGGFAAQHSQPAENWFLNVPGLKVVVPGTPADLYGLLRAAIEDPDPVLVFEHKALFNIKESFPQNGNTPAIGQAKIVREGTDVTVIATQLMRHRALEVADELAGEGIEVELIDPRSLVPLDSETLCGSVEKTHRLIVAQESSSFGSWGSSVLAQLVPQTFESLDAPPLLIGSDETPVPYAGALESAWMPSAERIAAAVRETVSY
jgi:acetoin:2,6-dichlorophenolindophenol oxidoreductase subunit beta